MRKMSFAILSIGVAIGISLAVPAAAETTLEKVRRQGFVTMGFMNEAPYVYVDDSKLTGADVAVLRHVLVKLGIPEVNGVIQEFQSLIPGLAAHRFDMNTAFFIRPARCKQVLFTAPLWAVLDSFIVKAGNPKKLHSYEDAAAQPDVKIGYLAAGVRTGRIDAFVNSAIGNQTLLDTGKDATLERATPFKPPVVDGKPDIGFGGFSFRPEDRDFYEAFNKEVVAFIGTPEHLALVRPFGFTEDDIKPAVGVKIDDLCRG